MSNYDEWLGKIYRENSKMEILELTCDVCGLIENSIRIMSTDDQQISSIICVKCCKKVAEKNESRLE